MPDAVVVTAVIAPAHILSMAKPGTVRGRPESSAAIRPMVRPWSPICVVAAIATSSTRSGGSSGWRRRSSRMQLTTMSSARVRAYMPFAPALPNGVRTPSTKTTSRREPGTGVLLAVERAVERWADRRARASSLPASPECYSTVTCDGETRPGCARHLIIGDQGILGGPPEHHDQCCRENSLITDRVVEQGGGSDVRREGGRQRRRREVDLP